MNNIIQGNPTKSFFIAMLTRDISIKDAIIDLLDNSIDGASNIKPNDYSGLIIDITVNKNEFIVKDNCGGFSLETAQKYAFRFGRPDDAPKTNSTVGRFGVGMKRALFKIGQYFEIESKSVNDHFQVVVDVENWKNKSKIIEENGQKISIDDWNFNFEHITPDTSNIEENGTYISVKNLYPDVSSIFEDDSFLNDLAEDIEKLLNFSLEKGITIILNGKQLQRKGIVLFNEQSSPYFFEETYGDVKIRVVAGLSYVGEPETSGWYIYCNDRLVLEADKSELTGWDKPKWHIDFVMFKGIVFFDSLDTIKLPLTTTKKGIDATSDIYKKALFFMKEAMTSIISFLRDVTKIDSNPNDYRKLLGEQESKISVVELKATNIIESRKFKIPEINIEVISVKNDLVRIAFDAEKNKVISAKKHSKTRSYKELGEYVFDYYLKMEELENE